MIRLLPAAVFGIAMLVAGCAGPPPGSPGARSAGLYLSTPDGHYRVRRGDTLYAIAFRYGLDWRDLARWNRIAAPYVIYPDQLLRLGQPGASSQTAGRGAAPDPPSPAVSTRAAPGASGATTKPLPTPGASTVTVERKEPVAQPSSAEAAQVESGARGADAARTVPGAPHAVTSPVAPGRDPDRWLWPAEGRILSRFQPGDPARKGIDIAGAVGQPVSASAGGVVVYSGSGLIGYGELIIIKHSDRMLSAYAHNRKRLVSEGQQVEAGSHIAEMGTNDRNQAVLHFEIRVNGTPEDPLRYLPRP